MVNVILIVLIFNMGVKLKHNHEIIPRKRFIRYVFLLHCLYLAIIFILKIVSFTDMLSLASIFIKKSVAN